MKAEGHFLVGILPADPFDFEAKFRVLCKERPDIEQMTTCEQHVEIVSRGTFRHGTSVTVAIWKHESQSLGPSIHLPVHVYMGLDKKFANAHEVCRRENAIKLRRNITEKK